MNFIKIEIFWSLKDTVKKIKRQIIGMISH